MQKNINYKTKINEILPKRQVFVLDQPQQQREREAVSRNIESKQETVGIDTNQQISGKIASILTEIKNVQEKVSTLGGDISNRFREYLHTKTQISIDPSNIQSAQDTFSKWMRESETIRQLSESNNQGYQRLDTALDQVLLKVQMRKELAQNLDTLEPGEKTSIGLLFESKIGSEEGPIESAVPQIENFRYRLEIIHEFTRYAQLVKMTREGGATSMESAKVLPVGTAYPRNDGKVAFMKYWVEVPPESGTPVIYAIDNVYGRIQKFDPRAAFDPSHKMAWVYADVASDGPSATPEARQQRQLHGQFFEDRFANWHTTRVAERNRLMPKNSDVTPELLAQLIQNQRYERGFIESTRRGYVAGTKPDSMPTSETSLNLYGKFTDEFNRLKTAEEGLYNQNPGSKPSGYHLREMYTKVTSPEYRNGIPAFTPTAAPPGPSTLPGAAPGRPTTGPATEPTASLPPNITPGETPPPPRAVETGPVELADAPSEADVAFQNNLTEIQGPLDATNTSVELVKLAPNPQFPRKMRSIQSLLINNTRFNASSSTSIAMVRPDQGSMLMFDDTTGTISLPKGAKIHSGEIEMVFQVLVPGKGVQNYTKKISVIPGSATPEITSMVNAHAEKIKGISNLMVIPIGSNAWEVSNNGETTRVTRKELNGRIVYEILVGGDNVLLEEEEKDYAFYCALQINRVVSEWNKNDFSTEALVTKKYFELDDPEDPNCKLIEGNESTTTMRNDAIDDFPREHVLIGRFLPVLNAKMDQKISRRVWERNLELEDRTENIYGTQNIDYEIPGVKPGREYRFSVDGGKNWRRSANGRINISGDEANALKADGKLQVLVHATTGNEAAIKSIEFHFNTPYKEITVDRNGQSVEFVSNTSSQQNSRFTLNGARGASYKLEKSDANVVKILKRDPVADAGKGYVHIADLQANFGSGAPELKGYIGNAAAEWNIALNNDSKEINISRR